MAAEALAFHPDLGELTAGMPVNVALTSGDMLHDLVVDEVGFHLAAEHGQTAGGLAFDTAGTYVGYCSVAGHRAAGMELQFVVAAPDDGHTPPIEH